MKNYFFTLIMFFSLGFITAQEEDGVSNGATFLQVDYIKTVPGKNYGQILSEKWAKLAEKRIRCCSRNFRKNQWQKVDH